MKCGKIRSGLYGYLKGELDPVRKASVEEHISLCPGCAAELAGIRRIKSMFSASLQEAPAGVLRSLRSRFKAPRPPLFWLKPALTASTVVIAALCIFIYSYNVNSRKTELSNFIISNYNVVDQSSFDNSDYEQTSYIYQQDEL